MMTPDFAVMYEIIPLNPADKPFCYGCDIHSNRDHSTGDGSKTVQQGQAINLAEK